VIGVYILVSPIGSLLKLYYDGAFCILLLDQARTSANRFLAIASNDNNLVNSPNGNGPTTFLTVIYSPNSLLGGLSRPTNYSENKNKLTSIIDFAR
jgi:hypothetical protein